MNLTEQAIQDYHALGWSVIPISPRTKRPLVTKWKPYQSEPPSAEQLEIWRKRWPTASWACITGLASGVFVVDVDRETPEALALVAKFPPTATVITSKGKHYYFNYPEPIYDGDRITNFQPGVRAGFLPGVDLRGEGGYAILPPSVHLDGHWYAWEDLPSDGIADCPADALEVIEKNHGLMETDSEGGWKARAYEKVPEGGRNQAAASLIGKLLAETPEDFWDLQRGAIKSWNENCCVPPLRESELMTTFESIAALEKSKRSHKEPVWVTAEELQKLDLPPVGYTIEEMLPEGLAMLIAKPKVGKSIFSFELALAVAGSKDALLSGAAAAAAGQEFRIKHGDVMYLALEDSYNRLKSRAAWLQKTGKWPKRLKLATQFPSMFEGGFALLQKAVREAPNPRLVVIDTWAAFLGSKESKGDAFNSQYRMLRPLWEFARDAKITILIVHHSRKSQQGSDYMDEVSGTLGVTAALDTFLVMRRKEGKPEGKLYITGRDVETSLLSLELVKDEGWNIVGASS